MAARAVQRDRGLRQARRRGVARHDARRRLRACAVLSLPDRAGQRQGGIPRGQPRPDTRRRRHAADAATRRCRGGARTDRGRQTGLGGGSGRYAPGRPRRRGRPRCGRARLCARTPRYEGGDTAYRRARRRGPRSRSLRPVPHRTGQARSRADCPATDRHRRRSRDAAVRARLAAGTGTFHGVSRRSAVHRAAPPVLRRAQGRQDPGIVLAYADARSERRSASSARARWGAVSRCVSRTPASMSPWSTSTTPRSSGAWPWSRRITPAASPAANWTRRARPSAVRASPAARTLPGSPARTSSSRRYSRTRRSSTTYSRGSTRSAGRARSSPPILRTRTSTRSPRRRRGPPTSSACTSSVRRTS